MTVDAIDTNVLLRFLVETPASMPAKFRGVFSFFGKLEAAEISVHLPDLVVFQTIFVLTSHYEVPAPVAAEKLVRLISFRGIQMTQKHLMLDCLDRMQSGADDLVDAWLAAWCHDQKRVGVYSFDVGLKKQGLELLAVE
ncbi:MAG TPA: hypothetical protein PKE55_01300 [Kiritimatiellia bacterium]|nr:hypothetical protein [Kiritimatiellia bacterium]